MEQKKSLRRFFSEGQCECGDTITISGSEFNHIKNVLRMREKDQITICFGDEYDTICEIVCYKDGHLEAKVLEKVKNTSEFEQDITFFQCAMKGDKMDFCVQKAVELGVKTLVPVISTFTISKPDDKKSQRWQKISVEASKQCGRAVVMDVRKPATLKHSAQTLGEFDIVLFCNETEKSRGFLDVCMDARKKQKIAVVVGSEGGFSKEEIALLCQPNVFSVSLGKRILRAETAGVYALSVLGAVLESRK